MSAVVASAPAVTKPFASYVIFVLVAPVIAAFSSTFASSAVCKSVWLLSVPVTPPQATAEEIAMFPLPSIEVELTVLIFVPLTSVACFHPMPSESLSSLAY